MITKLINLYYSLTYNKPTTIFEFPERTIRLVKLNKNFVNAKYMNDRVDNIKNKEDEAEVLLVVEILEKINEV